MDFNAINTIIRQQKSDPVDRVDRLVKFYTNNINRSRLGLISLMLKIVTTIQPDNNDLNNFDKRARRDSNSRPKA